MSEFEQIKNVWKMMSDSTTGKRYSNDELARMVKRQSKNELDLIRRKIIIEWTLALIIAISIVIVVDLNNPGDKKYAIAMVVFLLIVSFVPYFKVVRMRSYQYGNLKEYLTQYLNNFNRLIHQYVVMSIFLIPIAVGGGFLLGFHSTTSFYDWSQLLKPSVLIISIVLFVGISVLGNWMQRKYFRWIYGKNLDRLSACLNELNQVEE